ncbi:glycosyltransferase [Craurococcus roseus]|uniref:Glycosyltransferase n=1 Tax=Craurococcus roseus TaxID=77585 RepID=A0ABN1G4K8_9PROT
MLERRLLAAVAVPARDEADSLRSCLEALARQLGGHGWAIEPSAFAVLVFANNCTDATARVAREFAAGSPVRVAVLQAALPPERSHAGGARRGAMDAAAALLEDRPGAALLSTDADGRVAPDWLAANLAALAAGADAVAGAIGFDAAELAALPPALRAREEREAAYAALLDRMAWLIDPDPHDPWPRHGIHSGASMALTLDAYRRIGGLPAVPVGEDRALFDAVRRAGMRVRHCPEARVTVSCRLVGRAPGGMADTLLRRDLDAAAPTDTRLEPAADAFWRFRCRRVFRRAQSGAGRPGDVLRLSFALRLPTEAVARAAREPRFWQAWHALEGASPALARRVVPAPALAREARIAKLVLAAIGAAPAASKVAPPRRGPPRPPAAADRGGSARTVPAG